jgi:hypothetical protein
MQKDLIDFGVSANIKIDVTKTVALIAMKNTQVES